MGGPLDGKTIGAYGAQSVIRHKYQSITGPLVAVYRVQDSTCLSVAGVVVAILDSIEEWHMNDEETNNMEGA